MKAEAILRALGAKVLGALVAGGVAVAAGACCHAAASLFLWGWNLWP